MIKSHILLIETDARLRRLAKDYLGMRGIAVVEASSYDRAMNLLDTKKGLDMVILDTDVLKPARYDLLKKIYGISKLPLLLMAERADECENLLGYKSAVEQYIIKPVNIDKLVLRTEAILKNHKEGLSSEYMFGGITINKSKMTAYADGEDINLKPEEFKILDFMALNYGISLSRQKILDNVFKFDYHGNVRAVDLSVMYIRRKLGKYRDYIITDRGVGYRFEIDEAK